MISQISREVYNQHIKGSKEQTQNEIVLAFMRTQTRPMTIRMMHKHIKMDFGDLKRCVNYLSNGKKCEAKLVLVKKAPCEVTKVTAGYYVLKSYQLKLL